MPRCHSEMCARPLRARHETRAATSEHAQAPSTSSSAVVHGAAKRRRNGASPLDAEGIVEHALLHLDQHLTIRLLCCARVTASVSRRTSIQLVIEVLEQGARFELGQLLVAIIS